MDSTWKPADYQAAIAVDDGISEPLSDHSGYPALCPDIYNADDYTFCHWAKTITGWDANSERWLVLAQTCKRWGCPYCAVRKVRRLAWMTKNANPNILLTLTISSHRFPSGKAGWDAMAKAFPELIRFLRTGAASRRKPTAKEYAEHITPPLARQTCEYLRVLELTEIGTPHFHCLLRSPFILQADVLAEWRRLIGEPDPTIGQIAEIHHDGDEWRTPDGKIKQWAGVNVKGIDKSFATFRYLVKYLTKLHKLPWTDRHVSYSREFFMADDLLDQEYAKLDHLEKHDQHPWVWLRERLAWEQVTVLADGKWVLPAEIPAASQTIDPKSLGLPGEPDPAPPPPLAQRLVPGLADADQPDQDDHLDARGKRKSRSKKRNPAKIDQWQPPATPQPVPETPF